MKTILPVLCWALLATPAAAELKAEIQKVDDAFAAAANKGDGAAVGDLYADDATALPPGADMVRGKKAILEFWKKTVGDLTDLKANAVEVLPLGRFYAREIGTFSFKTRSNPPQQVAGKYVVLWHKVGGRWKLNTDIWNTNK